MKEFLYVLIVAIICLTIIECVAISHGINGYLFIAVITAIGSIIGAGFDHFYKKFKYKIRHENQKDRGN